ncbi:MAG: choice-of-anchor B family protein [Gemmatimonadetes bacterium]|nr:choice-of-anchor B family protein [Gemmatimonadota bacterium]
MTARLRSPFLLICLVVGLPLGALGQNQYASAVAAAGGDVLVLKPRYGQGPATVYVYRSDGMGGWELVEQLRPEAGESSGESFSASMTLTGDLLLVGGADPAAQWGAHTFRRGTAGSWSAGDKLALGVQSSGEDAWDLAALMRILQPPPRVVAADGARAVVAVVGGPARTSGVRIFERTGGAGRWSEQARLERTEAEASDRFGFAVAIRGNHALVGAPGHGAAGATYVFTRDEGSGAWRQDTILAVRAPAGGGFGSAVMFDGDVALIGAPGHAEAAGFAVAYARDDATGVWAERSRLLPSGGAFGDLFGTAFALAGEELLVGAPGADDRRGRVHRFSRNGADGSWQSVGGMVVPDVEPGFGVGSSIAVDADVAVVAAPGADARNGRAAVFTRSADGGWTHDTWLSLDRSFEVIAGEEVRCEEGRAAQFECSDVDLLAFLPVSALGGGPGAGVSDLWGWTDPTTGREYALVARTGGVAVVDVTEPSAPVYLGLLSAGLGSALDVKVYQDHAFFIGGGAATGGMLIFDLTLLRDVTNPPVTFEPDAAYEGIASAHNLIIDTSSGFAYIVGANGGRETCGGGLHMVDIRDPVDPTFAGCYTDTEGLLWAGRTHDGQCVQYHGPDENYRGRQVCFASNETALRIVDVTDKANPVPVAAATYPGMAYVHQGWLTDDHRYFYMDDELDELTGLAETTRTLVWDVAELDDPILVGQYFGPTKATDHNLYVKGNRMYLANYQAGLRIIDISDRQNPVEVGFFDTTPYEGNPPTMGGAWTAYPFFESGTIVVSSMNEGLFILRPAQRPVLVP